MLFGCSEKTLSGQSRIELTNAFCVPGVRRSMTTLFPGYNHTRLPSSEIDGAHRRSLLMDSTGERVVIDLTFKRRFFVQCAVARALHSL